MGKTGTRRVNPHISVRRGKALLVGANPRPTTIVPWMPSLHMLWFDSTMAQRGAAGEGASIPSELIGGLV